MFSIVLNENVQTYSPWGADCCFLSPWSVRCPRLSTETTPSPRSRAGMEQKGGKFWGREKRMRHRTPKQRKGAWSLENLISPKVKGKKGIKSNLEKDPKTARQWNRKGNRISLRIQRAPEPGNQARRDSRQWGKGAGRGHRAAPRF